MITQPFQAQTVTASLSVGTTSSNVAMPAGSTYVETVRLVNNGANVIYVELTGAASAATASVSTSLPMLPNSVETFSFPRPTFISAVSGTAGNTLFVTGGMGA